MVRNYKYSQGTYTPVVDVCAIGHNHDSVRGINNAGMLVDQTCCNGLPTKTGFAFGPGVRANRLTVPGAKEAEVRGIDNSSPTPHMVGHYVDDHRRTRGALWNRLSDAPGRSYDFAPEAVRTMVTGINHAGQMVGEFQTGAGPTTRDRGFMHGPGGDGTFVYPGAQDTRARGIDNPDVRGRFDVVGYFLPHWSDQRHGSIATVSPVVGGPTAAVR